MFKILVSGTLLFAACSPCFAQQPITRSGSADSTIHLSEKERPQFKGGDEALQKYLNKNLVYPEKAKKQNVEGVVIVGFLIDKEGECKNFRIVKSLDKSCDAAALRVLKDMPKWKPARVNNEAIATEMQVPVTFKINKTLIIENNKKTKNKYR